MRKRKRKQADLSGFVEEKTQEVSPAPAAEEVTAQPDEGNAPELEQAAEKAAVEPGRSRPLAASHFQFAAIIILGVLVIVLAILLAVQRSPLRLAFDEFSTRYPDSVMTVQFVPAEAGAGIHSQLREYCPEFGSSEFYLVQLGSSQQAVERVMAYDINTGALLCSALVSPTQSSAANTSTSVLATVNGEPVSTEEVLAIYNAIPEQERTPAALQQAFDQAISNKLLLQEAASLGITASPEEVDVGIASFLESNGLTMASLEANLQQAGSSLDKFRSAVRNDLTIKKRVQALAALVPNATEQDAKDYYSTFKENITSRPSAVSRQITFYANGSSPNNRSLDAKQVNAMINSTNFCEIAKQYSEDEASKNDCGTYSAVAGTLLPEYEAAVFSSKPGERNIISTRVGYHIVEVISVSPARQLSYDEASQDIKAYLTLLRIQESLASHLNTLRQEADIINYAAQGAGQ